MKKTGAQKQAENIRHFDEVLASYVQKGYEAKLCEASMLRANLLGGGIALGIGIIAFVVFGIVHNGVEITVPAVPLFETGNAFFDMAAIVAVALLGSVIAAIAFMVVSALVHEGLHAAGFKLFLPGRWRDNVYIGVAWRVLTPYCWAKYPVKMSAALFGGLLPVTVLGFGIYALALITGNGVLLFIAVINILSGGGDLLYAAMVIRSRPQLVYDNPLTASNAMGFTALYKH
jgi:hypothetical protein